MARRPRRRSSIGWGGLIVLAVVFVLVWRSERPQRTLPISTEAPGTGGVVGVFVEPDDGRRPILDELEAARQSIDLEVYLLSDGEIIDALIRADRRGVRVRVILEENPFGGPGNQPRVFARLQDAGVDVRWAPRPYRFAHIKTFVIDGAVAIVMNLNLTRTSFTDNREFGAVTTRPGEVAQAAAIFEADWAGDPDPLDGPLVVSPSSSRRELLDLIEGARTSLDVYAEVVRDRETVDALSVAEGRGVEVRLIVPEEEDEGARAILGELKKRGVEVRTLTGLYAHAKLVVVDERRAFVGSQNFTATSLDENRELGLLVEDPGIMSRLDRTFGRDFAKSPPLA